MEPVTVVIVIALFVFGGLLTYTTAERRHQPRWVRYEPREIEPLEGPFRRAFGPPPTRDVLVQNRAPKTIRRTALWSIYMGQMAIPGALLGLFGLIAMGIGLVSIPGLILAVRIWRSGFAMLRRDGAAEHKLRDLASFAITLNMVGVCVALFLVLAFGTELVPVSVVLVAYAGVSYTHAIALRRCADLLAKDRQLRARDESGACANSQEIQPSA